MENAAQAQKKLDDCRRKGEAKERRVAKFQVKLDLAQSELAEAQKNYAEAVMSKQLDK